MHLARWTEEIPAMAFVWKEVITTPSKEIPSQAITMMVSRSAEVPQEMRSTAIRSEFRLLAAITSPTMAMGSMLTILPTT